MLTKIFLASVDFWHMFLLAIYLGIQSIKLWKHLGCSRHGLLVKPSQVPFLRMLIRSQVKCLKIVFIKLATFSPLFKDAF